jgi:hypothetical protein
MIWYCTPLKQRMSECCLEIRAFPDRQMVFSGVRPMLAVLPIRISWGGLPSLDRMRTLAAIIANDSALSESF